MKKQARDIAKTSNGNLPNHLGIVVTVHAKKMKLRS